MEEQKLLKEFEKEKWQKLILSLLIDVVGNITYIIPGIGEWADLIIAPLTAAAIYKVHDTKIGAGFGFLEEILPFTDVIPTATIIWAKKYFYSKEDTFKEFIAKKQKNKEFIDNVLKHL